TGCRDLPHIAGHVLIADPHLGCGCAGDLDIVPGDGDVLPGDLDGSVGLHADRAAAAMKIDLGLGVDGDLGIERLDHDVLGDVGALGVIDGLGHGALGVLGVRSGLDVQLVGALADGDVRGPGDRLGVRTVDRDRAVVLHVVGLVVLHRGTHIVLAVDRDLFLTGGVVGGDLVVAGALVCFGLDAADDRGARQGVRRHVVAVVDPPDDDRLVGVALQEVDDHLPADARDRDRAPILAGPRLRDAHPAARVLVALAVAVPVELHLDPPVLVGVDLVGGRPDDDGGLWAAHRRPGRGPRRAELLPALQ